MRSHGGWHGAVEKSPLRVPVVELTVEAVPRTAPCEALHVHVLVNYCGAL